METSRINLIFGVDCCTPSEAAILPLLSRNQLKSLLTTDKNYIVVLSYSVRQEAVKSIGKAQKWYKTRNGTSTLGDWVLVYFPLNECGCNRKLSWPWHGRYYVVETKDPDITVSKAYFPQEKTFKFIKAVFNYALVIFLLAIIGMALREQDTLQNGLMATDQFSEVQSNIMMLKIMS